jgi:hypothetical protein
MVGLVTFETAQLRDFALSISAEAHREKPGSAERGAEKSGVVEAAMAPTVKGLVQHQAVVECRQLVCPFTRVVMRVPHPVEIRSREAKGPRSAEDAPALGEKGEPLLECQVLDEVLGEDEREFPEGKTIAYVEGLIHSRAGLEVDVPPAGESDGSCSDVETGDGLRLRCADVS